ncbi:PREDICTED: uncharacterized protein LOC105453028 [Wasmannia auropunctata]|uniref:uncharacterized protein LOC105453028 n=1 Tax=Wasmannia auropunctata TaxID=64793 RepID=UPI0005EEC895|nr:PREDICTED: uncharacterized protein LOC105453028 [Wasmannia auropunctata]
MAHSPANEIPSAVTCHTEQLIRPEVSTVELPADLPRGGNKSRRYENSPLLNSDATYNVRDFITQEDNESLDKSYGDGSPNEICAFKLDQGKIDELSANDYHAETCVSSSRESAIQKESRKETVKNDGALSRNEDESRCKSNRKRKTRRKMPDGVVIDLSNDIYGMSRGGIKISVISMYNLVPEMKFIAVPKKRHSMWNPNSRNKIVDNSMLAVLCAESSDKMKKSRRSTRRKYKNYSKESKNDILYRNASTTVDAPKKFENILNGRELHPESNTQSLCTPHEILNSTQCCHHNDTMADIDNARYPILNIKQTCDDVRKRIANYCSCSIFNGKHQEYHICDREDYNTDGSDFNTEMQADWSAECFHPECARARGCRCFYDSSEYDPDINMQRDRCPLMSQTARLFENSALLWRHQREEIGADEPRTDIAPEFATEADEYSPDGVERCRNCDGEKGSSTGTIRKRAASKASVLAEPGGSVADLRDSRSADASRCEIDTRPGKRGWWTATTATTTMAERDADRSYKSNSLKAADTWDARARRDNCIGRRCAGRRVVAEPPSRPDQHPGKKGGSARGVDSEWRRGSIETDAQQLDYKWKRRIATVDAGTRARVDFKGKRDSR